MTVIKEAYSYVDPSVFVWIVMAICCVVSACGFFRESLWRGIIMSLISLWAIGVSILLFCFPMTRMEVIGDDNFKIKDVVDAGWEIVEQDGKAITLERFADFGDWE